jgi:hypothetical protein
MFSLLQSPPHSRPVHDSTVHDTAVGTAPFVPAHPGHQVGFRTPVTLARRALLSWGLEAVQWHTAAC